MIGFRNDRPPPAAAGVAGDPAMDDILASIRRMLDDEGRQGTPQGEAMSDREPVLKLEPSMMVPETKPGPVVAPVQDARPVATPEGLVAPAAAAATAQSIGSLVRTLAAERTMQVHSGGPTLEDLVRDEMRPLLKQWLDTNLPPLVERLVRAEIERVVGRSVP
jgi:cell pole-organizing protein PopZ